MVHFQLGSIHGIKIGKRSATQVWLLEHLCTKSHALFWFVFDFKEAISKETLENQIQTRIMHEILCINVPVTMAEFPTFFLY